MNKRFMNPLIWIFLICGMGYGQNQVIPLWPDGPPGAIDDPTYIETLDTDQPWRIRNVSDPTLSIYLPPSEKANGTAVIICPGGGYVRLAFNHEGFMIAEWLNTQGIAGIVLKYRLPDDRIMQDKSIGPLQDVQETIRTVRRHAAEWGIDPHKVGVMGFSAGGHVAATASTLFDERVYEPVDSISARPDFSVLIYPVISFRDSIMHPGSRERLLGDTPPFAQIHRFSADEQVTPKTPPAFLVHSFDDKTVPVENTLRYSKALWNHHVPCEVHLFELGGHGYAISRCKGSEAFWPEILAHWLKMRGWL